MIRIATKYDKEDICEMMRLFRLEADLPEYKDVENINHLLDPIFAGHGVIFLEENKGLLMAITAPTIWCNKTLAMYELAWYVKPEHRNTTIGYRLFVSYLNYGKKLKEENKIKYFTVSKMDTSPDLNYKKFGFRIKDENWIQ
jgi:hypothetical protein